ncbi:MAG: hypothetical protein LBU90_09915 [Bacteroidales bacterium]|nr:hypothetical protein [Bacteroidales bacterium]
MFASEIIFTTNSSKPFQIVIDNFVYTSANGMIALNNLNAGTYNVQIATNPNFWGEFRNVSFHSIFVNPHTRTFYEVNTFGSGSVAYVEALHPSANMFVTVHLHRPAIRTIVYSSPAPHRPTHAVHAAPAPKHAAPAHANSHSAHAAPAKPAPHQATAARPAPQHNAPAAKAATPAPQKAVAARTAPDNHSANYRSTGR